MLNAIRHKKCPSCSGPCTCTRMVPTRVIMPSLPIYKANQTGQRWPGRSRSRCWRSLGRFRRGKALTKAISRCFPQSSMLLCIRHLENNARRRLQDKVGVPVHTTVNRSCFVWVWWTDERRQELHFWWAYAHCTAWWPNVKQKLPNSPSTWLQS